MSEPGVSLGRLRYAIKKRKNDEVYAILQAHGVDAVYPGLGSALSLACMSQNWEIAAYCITNGADVHARDADGGTALVDACAFGHCETVRLLVEAGAEIDAANKYDKRPIAKAIAHHPRNYRLIEYLLEHGADPFVQERYQSDDPRRATFTAYDYAKREIGDRKRVALLDRYRKA